ncbi:hypothetical protein ABZZ80_05075 [Streptomyces sp. NPDC006356]
MKARGSSAKKEAASAADEREERDDPAPGQRHEEGIDLEAAFIVLHGGDVEADEPVRVSGLHLPPGSVETV